MSPLAQILIGVGAISAITTLLAVIMVIADATIGNYGSVQIKINDEKDVTVEGGRSLLSSLMDEKILSRQPAAVAARAVCARSRSHPT